MSKKRIIENMRLTREYNRNIALIETEYFEYLDKENGEEKWTSLSIDSLPFIPVIIKPIITEMDNEIICKLSFEFPYTHCLINSTADEKYILDKTNKCISPSVAYISTPNNENLMESVRYNNNNIQTLSKIKHQETVMSYLNSKRKSLFLLHNLCSNNYNSHN